MDSIKNISVNIRRTIIELAHRSKCPHVGSSLSCADILTVLYFKKMNFEPWAGRDIFILSKAHAEMALYAILAEKGILNKDFLNSFCENNGKLPGHLDRSSAKGIEVSGGSLGHGFNIGIGLAYGFKKKNKKSNVYVVIGDGETEEGSIWEGALFAPKLGVDNFTAILDYNNLQGYGKPRDICYFEPVRDKWEAFGWHVIEADGHDFGELESALNSDSCGTPKLIIAHTTKGKGVSFMENELIWHYYIVTDEHKKIALGELQ